MIITQKPFERTARRAFIITKSYKNCKTIFVCVKLLNRIFGKDLWGNGNALQGESFLQTIDRQGEMHYNHYCVSFISFQGYKRNISSARNPFSVKLNFTDWLKIGRCNAEIFLKNPGKMRLVAESHFLSDDFDGGWLVDEHLACFLQSVID